MGEKESKKYKGIIEYLLSDFLEHYNLEIKPDGWAYYLRAMTAQFLWVMVGLFLGWYIFTPIKNIYIHAGSIALFGGFILELWNRSIKKRLPKSLDDLVSGEIFFEIDMNALNKYIGGLIALIVACLFGPEILRFIQNSYEKK